MMLSARSVKQHEDAAEAMVVSTAERRRQEQQEQQEQQQPRGEATKPLSCGGHKSARSNHGGSSTQRSDSTHLASSSSSTGSYNSSGLSTFRSSVSSSGEVRSRGKRSSRSSSSGSSGRRTRRPTSYDATIRDATTLTNNDPAQRQQLSHRSASSSARENRLRPPALLLGHRTLPPPSSSARPGTHHPSRPRALDPVFDRHHKYDLIAEEQAAKGGEVTGRYGEIHGSSVMAANLLTSELSTPWSHVLRGQKWWMAARRNVRVVGSTKCACRSCRGRSDCGFKAMSPVCRARGVSKRRKDRSTTVWWIDGSCHVRQVWRSLGWPARAQRGSKWGLLPRKRSRMLWQGGAHTEVVVPEQRCGLAHTPTFSYSWKSERGKHHD